jgi:dolichol-phosphate mannosyltransferase
LEGSLVVVSGGAAPTDVKTFAVIPAYRAGATIRRVIEEALEVVSNVIVVDDACPQHSCDDIVSTSRVRIIRHLANTGVGGAMKTGIREALAMGADIIVKIDADGQMNTAFVPQMIALLFAHTDVDLVKGNRFADPATLNTMPPTRLIGNAGLTFFVKVSSGYWTIVDPTNGFLAIRASALTTMHLEGLADRYFFEIDLLCSFGLRRRTIAEMEMPAIYGAEPSSLSVTNALFTFPRRLLICFLRRILVNYLIVEVNVGTLCAAIGLPTLLAAIIFGGNQWALALQSGLPRPTGSIVLALLLFTIGFQLALQAVLYDVQFSPKTVKARADRIPVRESSPRLR